MSPDLERSLRAARRTLPEPDEDVGRRARRAALATVARRRPSGRVFVALAAALAAATAVGFGFGQRLGPEQVQAAEPGGVFGAGFLPAEGWSTFQTARSDGAVALAANVPLAGDDVARAGAVVPRTTLEKLPNGGIVIVALLKTRGSAAASDAKPAPLVLRQARRELHTIAGRTMSVRHLRSRAAAHDLDVTVYFGSPAPSAAVVGLGQRELERLVVEGPKVTIRVRVYQEPGAVLREVEVTGRIASSAGGELVDVQTKECGPSFRFYRLVGQARTVDGGSWKLVTTRDGVDLLNLPVTAYYRARWQGTFSAPALARTPIFANLFWDRKNRSAVALVSSRPAGHNLRRKFVELQRKVEGTDQWVRVRRARLTRAPAFWGTDAFQARFPVRTRGLTLRVFVPPATAAPCFGSAASPSIKP